MCVFLFEPLFSEKRIRSSIWQELKHISVTVEAQMTNQRRSINQDYEPQKKE